MKLTSKQYAHVLYTLLKNSPKINHKSILKNFVLKLNRDRALKRKNDILYALSVLIEAENKSLSGVLYTAHEISKSEASEIETKMAKILGVNSTSLTLEKNEELLGGFKAVFDEYTVDASVLNNLLALREILIS